MRDMRDQARIVGVGDASPMKFLVHGFCWAKP
jgi:hypothetical protein